MNLQDLEQNLRGLLRGEFSSLSISFNDEHACNYCDAATYAEEYGRYEPSDMWISPEDRALALANNTVWSIQWYPSTPVGFCRICASSLEKLLAAVFSNAAESEQ